MADPVTVSIKLPLHGDGWIQVQAHITGLDGVSGEDEQFVLDLVDRVRAMAGDMRAAGLLGTPPGPEGPGRLGGAA